MPSPFPGMDPYLEGALWTTLHHGLGSEIVRQLAPKLRPRYIALPVERFVMDIDAGVSVTTASTYPDVGVVETQQPPAQAEAATVSAPLRLATVIPEAVPHVTVEIRDTRQRQLVTAIEILSPTNKRGEGRREYVLKRQCLLLSSTPHHTRLAYRLAAAPHRQLHIVQQVDASHVGQFSHLMEIDLLRTGERVPMQQALPEAPYFVLLSRAEDRPLMEVWPIALADPLPTVPVPLLPDDPDVHLDLQAAFTAAYDLPGYDLIVDYTQPPDVPFTEEEAAWVETHLRQAGLRG